MNQSLQKIARGAVLVLIGTVVGMFLGMVGRIMVARYVTPDEYGIYSLAWVLLNVFVLISILGLHAGLPRQIAFYRGEEDEGKVRGIVLSSLRIAIISGVFFSLVLFLASGLISVNLFHTPEMSVPLRIFCIAIPFLVLINVFTAIFRGFDRAEPNVYFREMLRNVLFPVLLVAVILLGLSFMGVVYAFVASNVLTFVVFAIYTIKRPPLALRGEKAALTGSVTKELLLFSLPLFAMGVLGNIMAWADTLMLGYFMAPGDVGLYNAALPLVYILTVAFAAVNFLYLPLASQLYARGQKEEIKRNYVVLSKWIFAAMLPVFLIFVLFPEATLNILFSSRYMAAAPALQILSLGFFVQYIVLGLGGVTLIAMGETRFVMWALVITVIADIALNVLLIPPLGIIGAAIATASAVILGTLVVSVRLYLLSRIHPFTLNYLKPGIVSLVLIFGISVLVKNLVVVIPIWLLLVLLVAFLGVYALAVLFTRSFDKEDIAMLLTIERRLGIDLAVIKRILRRFV